MADTTVSINKHAAYNSNLPQDRVFTGDVFIDPYTNEKYVYADNGWEQHTTHFYVNVTPTSDTEKILNWAKRKMEEEQKLEALREEYPALDEAIKDLDAVKAIVGANEG